MLSQVEKRLDLVKQVSHSTHKKLNACLQGQQGTDMEKRSVKSPSVSTGVSQLATVEVYRSVCNIFSMYRQKKLPLTILAQCMEEGAAVLGEDSLLGLVTTNTPVLNSHTHRVIFNYRFGSWILLCPYYPCVHFNCIWLLMTLCLAFTNRKMLKLCGETEEKLAQELIQFEYQIERDVVEPLYVLAEVSR